MTLTTNEAAVLKALDFNDFHDGAETVGNHVWSNCINCPGIIGKSLSGVVSSLKQKGYVWTSGMGHKDDTIYVTQAGYDAYVETGVETRAAYYTRRDLERKEKGK